MAVEATWGIILHLAAQQFHEIGVFCSDFAVWHATHISEICIWSSSMCSIKCELLQACAEMVTFMCFKEVWTSASQYLLRWCLILPSWLESSCKIFVEQCISGILEMGTSFCAFFGQDHYPWLWTVLMQYLIPVLLNALRNSSFSFFWNIWTNFN